MKIGQESILGIFFAVTGCIALWISLQYPFGTAGRMGPGYFPVIVSSLLAVTGILVLVRNISVSGDAFPAIKWKALVIVPLAIIVFGLAIEPLGLLPAIFLLLVLSAATSIKFRFDWKAVTGALVFSSLCALFFVKLIGLPMPLLGTWLQ